MTEPTSPQEILDALKTTGYLEEHEGCSKHGAIRRFAEFDRVSQNDIVKALRHFYGMHCLWYDKKLGLEYNVSYFKGGKPWDYCGTTMLFDNWYQRDTANAVAKLLLNQGDTVYFMHEGEKISGVISRINKKRVTVLLPNSGGHKWYVPARDLIKE